MLLPPVLLPGAAVAQGDLVLPAGFERTWKSSSCALWGPFFFGGPSLNTLVLGSELSRCESPWALDSFAAEGLFALPGLHLADNRQDGARGVSNAVARQRDVGMVLVVGRDATALNARGAQQGAAPDDGLEISSQSASQPSKNRKHDWQMP